VEEAAEPDAPSNIPYTGGVAGRVQWFDARDKAPLFAFGTAFS